MTEFRVWAPRPDRVELAVAPASGDRTDTIPMEREDGGWWHADVPDAGPGTRYGFVLDGDGPFPDPRSPSQPDGVHGLSALADHAAFAWTDEAWSAPPLEEAVIYELHVGTFSAEGTFDGAIRHLDRLVELGITHVELMPVAEFPGGRGWGYDGVDLYAPEHAYGGPDGLRRFVDACHDRRIGVLLDVVYNHLGPDGNYLERFGPYFSHRYTTPWGDAINFDGPGSDEVRRWVIDNGLMWLRDYHVDGLRLDAVHEIFDQSAVHILEQLPTELHAAAAALGRRFVVIAESDLNNPRLVTSVERGGYGLDAHWNDDFRHSLHVALTGESDVFHAQYRGLADLATSLERIYVFDGRWSPYRHRHHGRPAGDLPATRFVGFLQNHDQAGNRAFGERSSHLMSPDALRVAAAFVLLGPFVPLLFAGEEWGASTPFLYFTDHQDPLLAEAVRVGRRRDFARFVPDEGEIPDPQDPASFARSKLDWDERDEGVHAGLLGWHRRLVAFRRAHPGLRDGSRPAVRFDPEACWMTAARAAVMLAGNFSDRPVTVPLDDPGPLAIELASTDGISLDGLDLRLPPWSAAVLEHRA